ncbi:MAG: UvrD-helicase domain-containing protein [Phycisphaerales bacterium]|nr:UvrD-helicase domain-containing protein [Phycisphaerales bacterium]
MRPLAKCEIIMASAGSGKTRALTGRYIGLLAAGADPRTILATTFSRKAAAEIRDRIVDRLASAIIDPEKLSELEDAVPQLTGGSAQCVQLLRNLTSQLHRLDIGTIDSFFVQTAKFLSDQLGFPPGWSIMDDVEFPRIFGAAAEQFLGDNRPVGVATTLRAFENGAKVPVIDAIDRLQKNGYALAFWTTKDAWDGSPRQPLVDQVRIDAGVERLRAFESDRSRLLKRINSDIGLIEAGDWAKVIKKGIVGRIIFSQPFDGSPIPVELTKAYGDLVDHAKAVFHNSVIDQNLAARKLLDGFHKHWTTVKHAASRYTFDDITRYLACLNMLADREDLLFRLDGSIDHLLVDEFQDTSLQQWKVLSPWVKEIDGDETTDRSLFFVGDVKQSLYGFRGGEPALLRSLPEQLGVDEPVHLDCSWRCSPPVIEAVNTMFLDSTDIPRLTNHSEIGLDTWRESFHPHVAAVPDRPGHATVQTACGDTPEEMDEEVIRQVAAINRAAPWATIGVLVRSAKKQRIQRLVHGLRNNDEHPVFASEHRGNPLTDSPPVTVILSALLMADHPGDSAATFHVATSPLGEHLGLAWQGDSADNAAIAESIRRSLVRDGYANVIAEWATVLVATAKQRDRLRLWQLMECAETASSLLPLRPSEFVAAIRTQAIADPASSQVQVMTIHKSKGLQFDAVVVGDTTADLWRPPQFLKLNPDPCELPTRVGTYQSKEIDALLPDYKEMRAQSSERQVDEALCLLYVAMTRAKHALHIVLPPRPDARSCHATIDGMVRECLQCDAALQPSETIWSAKSGNASWYDEVVDSPEVSSIDPTPSGTPGLKSPTGNTRGIPTTSPSGLQGGQKLIVKERFSSDTERAMARGTLVHAWMEDIHWLEEPPTPEELVAAASPSLPDEEMLATAEQVHARLSDGEIRDLLIRPAGGKYLVRCEQPFVVRVAAGTKLAAEGIDQDTDLRGMIDRLVVTLDDAGSPSAASVIDWKTDAVEPENLQATVAEYASQLAAYRLAASRLLGLQIDDVTPLLAFLSTGQVLDVTTEATISR